LTFIFRLEKLLVPGGVSNLVSNANNSTSGPFLM